MRMRWLFGRGNVRAPWIVAILVLINALLLRAIDPPELSRLRDLAFDSYQRLKPRAYNPDMPVRIVDIDEEALAEYGQWPWPRTILARLVDKLTEQGAAVIAFDVVFAEPDRSSISRMVRDLVAYTDPETVQKLAAAVQDNDQVLADAMAHSRVVLGFGFDLKGGQTPPKRHHGMAFAGDNPLQFLPVQQGTVKAIPLLEAAAKGNGSVNTDLETVVIRRVPMLFRLAGTGRRLSHALDRGDAGGAGRQQLRDQVVRRQPGGVVRHQERHRRRQDRRPAGPHRRARPHDPLRHRPSQRALRLGGRRAEGHGAADKIDGQIVFIGTSAIGLKDMRSTPVDDAVPGVEVHAQLAEQMLTQDFLARPDFADGAEFLYLGLIGILFVLLLPRLSAGAHGDRRGGLHRHRACRALACLLGISTCCSIRSIRR